MNAKDFTDSLRAYYGPSYTEVERQVVGPWVVRFERQGGDFSALFDAVTEQVSKAFGKLPDKAQLAEASKGLRRDRDPNALPPPPINPKLTGALSIQEQAELEAGIVAMMPSGWKPSATQWGPREGAARVGEPLRGRLLG